MKDFRDKLAVVTGAGSGIGRELARQLAAAGCHLALCDVSAEGMAETKRLCASNVRISAQLCDVSVEAQVLAFREATLAAHRTNQVNLLFNNAGIGGGGSFIADERAEWEKTFGVCWFGVYYCSRAFLPLLIASDEACLVNVSSVNGFWASLGPGVPHTAYSAAKFAVKGFTEALLNDLRVNAPHVGVAVVMPGHIGTSILVNTNKLLGKHSPADMTAAELAALRLRLQRRGMPVDTLGDEALRALAQQVQTAFLEKAPTTAAQAASIILDGVRNGRWRILVGADAEALDARVRAAPEAAYERAFLEELRTQGHFAAATSAPRPPRA
ncbi:MAG: SDR family NAD(P)-dependent oxidoreductase [Burkholderiales bacterium]